MIALTTDPASRAERRVVTVVIAASLLLFVALAGYADVPAGRSELFMPIYESVLAMCDFITCIFLFGQFSLSRASALLLLAGGYLFSAVMALMHELSFPGLFAPAGLLWAGAQTTAWLYFLWHLGFPAAVIVYALSATREAPIAPRYSAARGVAGAVLGALALAGLALWTSTAGARWLPHIMHGNEDRPAKFVVAWFTWLVTLAALPVLWRFRRRSALDLWLLAVIVAWSCDIGQAAVFNAGRFSFGWYAGRIYGLGASSFLLVVLILESSRLHQRLAEAHAAEREQRRLAEGGAAQLKRLAGSLEERIQARTSELEQANEALRQTRDELHKAAALGTAARESERARLARELHDELGQTLLMLKFQLSDLEAHCRELQTPVLQKTRDMRRLIDLTFAAARRVATDLRPSVLDVLGLPAAAQWLVETFRQHNPLEIRLRIEPREFAVEEPYATAAFRILQEALTNIARHSEATQVEVELVRQQDQLRLRVSDDGCGFDPELSARADAFGLLGMRERAGMVGGVLQITSAPGRGTTVALLIELESRTNATAG